MSEEKNDEYNVIFVEDDKGNRLAKVVRGKITKTYHKETQSELERKWIRYSKIAGGISIFSLLISLALFGLGATANIIAQEHRTTTNTLGIILGILGITAYALAFIFDKKTKKQRTKRSVSKKKKKSSRRKKK